MSSTLIFCYNFVLSLWIGGISIFTFIITPVIFKSFDRDTAGRIVGQLFSGYYMYTLALSILALIFLFMLRSFFNASALKLSLVLVVCAVIINLFVAFKLHPEIRQVKQEIHSFETDDDNSLPRRRFGKLHAVSAALNLLLLADGITLLLLISAIKKH